MQVQPLEFYIHQHYNLQWLLPVYTQTFDRGYHYSTELYEILRYDAGKHRNVRNAGKHNFFVGKAGNAGCRAYKAYI